MTTEASVPTFRRQDRSFVFKGNTLLDDHAKCGPIDMISRSSMSEDIPNEDHVVTESTHSNPMLRFSPK